MKITMSKQEQKQIYSLYEQKPILYNAGLALSLKSSEAAIILGQLIYWQGLGKDKDWTYKTIEEMKNETGLSRYKQDTAIKKLKALGLIEMELRGIPAKRHFHIDMKKIENSLSSLLDTNKLDGKKSPITNVDSPTSITKNNQRISSKNTQTNKNYKSFLKKKELLKRSVTPSYMKERESNE